MTRALRIAYVALAWLFVAGLVAVVVAAGYGMFVRSGDFEPHLNFGYILHLSPILLLGVALGARIGRPDIWWVVALTVLVLVQPFLPPAGGWLAALHPLNATIITFLAITVAIRSLALLRDEPAPA